MSIELTERAIEEVKKVMSEQEFKPEEYVLEAGCVGGGCSGFQFKLGFKEKKEVDPLSTTMFNFNGIDVVISNRALLYMEGTTIDFHEDLNKRGFIFNNPLARTTCGCGSSFSPG